MGKEAVMNKIIIDGNVYEAVLKGSCHCNDCDLYNRCTNRPLKYVSFCSSYFFVFRERVIFRFSKELTDRLKIKRKSSPNTIECGKDNALTFYDHLLDLVGQERMSKNFSEWCELEKEYIALIGEKHFTEHFKNK